MPDLATIVTTMEAMPPGEYLRRRRQAAGLTFQHVAIMLVPPTRRGADGDRAEIRRQLAHLEDDTLPGHETLKLVDRLGSVFSFDPALYWVLVGRAGDPGSEIPVPQICRGCACSWNDACPDGDHGCAWSDDDPTLCTVCQRAGRGAPSPAPANDREARHAS